MVDLDKGVVYFTNGSVWQIVDATDATPREFERRLRDPAEQAFDEVFGEMLLDLKRAEMLRRAEPLERLRPAARIQVLCPRASQSCERAPAPRARSRLKRWKSLKEKRAAWNH